MGARALFVNGIKSAYVTISTKAFMAAVVARFPFMAHPFLYKIAHQLVKELMNETAEDADVEVFFKYIDFRTNGQGVDFEKAAIENFKIQNSNASKLEKERAELELWAKFKPFAKFNG